MAFERCCTFLILSVIAVFAAGQYPRSQYQAGNNGNQKFAADAYYQLSKEIQGNFVYSPQSVQTILALLATGASGRTFQELQKGLSLPQSPEEISGMFARQRQQLRGNEHYALNSANRIFARNGSFVNPQFQTNAQQSFGADVAQLDFRQQAAAADKINKWTAQQTNNKIKEIVTPSDLSEDTGMVLVNALYFSGKWSSPFDAFDTKISTFYAPSSEQRVHMMNLNDYFNYYEDPELQAKFLELPYVGHDISMVFVLPDKRTGINRLEEDIHKVLQPKNFVRQNVKVSIPKFTMDTTLNFNEPLKKMHIQQVFTPDAELKKIANSAQPLFVSKVLQKLYISVAEHGTEAAAASAILLLERIGEAEVFTYVPFIADRPFLFYITIKPDNLILFVGRFADGNL